MAEMNRETIINRAKEIHGNKYNYTKVVDTLSNDKICIICPEHGEFWQVLLNHLRGHGCPICGGSKRKSNDTYIKELKEVWGNTYDFSVTHYTNALSPVEVICKKHGKFLPLAINILKGHGCPKCGAERIGLFHLSNTEDFIKKSKIVHGDKYIYTKVDYKKAKEKVCIICTEHGEFWQTPDQHLSGCGCPKCNYSQMERRTENLLRQYKVNFEPQKRFEWLGKLSLDFYLPQYNIAIECQGEQHYKPIKYIGGEEKLRIISERDDRKKILCESNGVKIFYIKYTENIENKVKELLKQIC